MDRQRLRVLLIEDDGDDYVLVHKLLSEISFTSYELEWVSTYETALDAAGKGRHDACLLDLRLGEHNGLDILRELTHKGYKTPIIFLTGQGDHAVDMEAMTLGAADYLVKADLNSSLLERTIRYAVERRKAEEELKVAMAELQESNEDLASTLEELRAAEEEIYRQYEELDKRGEELDRERQRYRDLFENAPDAYLVTNSQGVILEANAAAIAVLGMGQEFVLKKPLSVFVAEEDRDVFRNEMHFLRHSRGLRDWELRLRNFPASISVTTIYSTDGDEVSLRWLIRDISERKMAEEKLARVSVMLQTVFDGISDPLLMVGENLTVRMLNEASCRYFQTADHEEVIGKTCYELTNGACRSCDACRIKSAVSERRSVTFERQGLFDRERFEQITVYPLEEPGSGIPGGIIRISDITESKLIEKHLTREDRLSSLGQLSGGIAHEIRNPLAGINLFVEILCDEERFTRTTQELSMLEEIKSNIQKINGIIQRVLDLAKQSDARQMNLEVSPLLRDTLKFWSSRMTKDGIELRLSVEEGLPDILGDPIEIQQVINNLIQNAVEAMSGGGFLTITAEKGALSFDKNRPAVVIKIQDTGSGIPIDQQKNIFNPFFTTKSSGTGLGLAISHRILSRHRGILSFESTPNVGTTFFLELRPAPSPPTISTSG